MKELQLRFPTKEDKERVLDYLQEHYNHKEYHLNGDAGLDRMKDFDTWLDKIKEDTIENERTTVPSFEFLVIREEDQEIIGMVQIRKKLNDKLLLYGGHIGYGVRPTERKKGYATKILKLALEKCKEFGLEKVLLTTDKDNEFSKKVIIANQGILENEVVEKSENIVQRYWIEIK